MSDHVVAPELLAIMQCPACGGNLSERRDPVALVCDACLRAYPVRAGVPIMLIEQAETPPTP